MYTELVEQPGYSIYTAFMNVFGHVNRIAVFNNVVKNNLSLYLTIRKL
jgi:hypothetical protein